MKKLMTIVVAGLMVLVLGACSSDSTPEAVATKAVKCIVNKDYSGYVNLLNLKASENESADELKEQKEQIAALLQDKVDKDLEEKQGIKDYSVGTAEIDGNKASVPVSITYGNGTTNEDKVALVKADDGQWRIDMGK